MKAYPEYRDSGVEWLGRIPAGWQVLDLKHVCHVFPSNVDKHSKPEETPVRLCNYTDVYYNDRITADLDFMSATATEDEIAKFTLQPGDVIFTKDSETSDDIGIAALVHESLPGVICGYHLSIARPNPETSGRFLKAYFDSVAAKAHFRVSANGLTRVGLTQYAIDNLPVAVPPIKEQKAIGRFLDREVAKIDDLVAEQRRLIALLAEKRQAVISTAVTRGLNPDTPLKPSGIDWLGDVPEGWTVSPIRKLARLESGHTPSRSRPEWWVDCYIPWFSLADVWQIRSGQVEYVYETAEQVSDLGLANSSARLLPAGTVMLSRTASVGYSAIMGVDMATTQDFACWVCGPELQPEYLLYCLRGMEAEFKRIKMGSTHNTIYMPEIQAMKIALPPLDEQERIVTHVRESLNRLSGLDDVANSAITLLLERRAALISAAVTGKIDLRGDVTA